ncbi:MAG: AAA family ATPase [Gammaproteobacteria bacterium]|nr:AAA family ATPase [Gammaproteobacteria bacterium]
MKFSYGLADFLAIREEEYFYVDRTDRIPLIEEAGYQLLFLRPRRFGKSLWLSTLENYYDLAKADKFKTLFGGLKIGQNPTPWHNRYFILKLNFSSVLAGGDYHEFKQYFYNHINGKIQGFSQKYRNHLQYPIEIDKHNALSSFQSLLNAVAVADYPLYLLVDEYDNFANEVLISDIRGKERYQELVESEGIIKTFFKAVKESAEGGGLDRVFMTGVSPVVLSDMTSGYNVVKGIYQRPEYADLCGFTSAELHDAVQQVISECGLPMAKVQDVVNVMRTFYDGYRFSTRADETIYNPTLVLYFLDNFIRDCEYPEKILDDNLAMDRNRIHYVAQLPHGQTLVTQALAANDANPDQAVTICQFADRFGIQAMLNAPRDRAFLASLLYYFGVLTLDGYDELGKLRLTIPNLVVRKLYAERMQEALLPEYEDQERRGYAAEQFYAYGNLEPLCDLIEQKFFKVFDNRDLRWSNELTVKTAFLTLLFSDTFYIMDSETSIERGYTDLTLILRPDKRRFKLFDHVLEFKYLKWKSLGRQVDRNMDREALRELPPVAKKLAEAEAQLAKYHKTLEQVYADKLKLRTHAVVCIGLERLVW